MVENVQLCASNIVTLTGDVSGTRVDLAEIREHYQELMNAVQGLQFLTKPFLSFVTISHFPGEE